MGREHEQSYSLQVMAFAVPKIRLGILQGPSLCNLSVHLLSVNLPNSCLNILELAKPTVREILITLYVKKEFLLSVLTYCQSVSVLLICNISGLGECQFHTESTQPPVFEIVLF